MEDVSMSKTSIDEVNFEIVSITNKIIVTGMIVLFFVLAFCFVLSLYARWYLSRINHRDSSQVTTPARVAGKRRGVDRLTLISLPVMVYDPKDFKEELECSVCLSEILQGEKVRLLPSCNHGFHLECIDKWFKSHSTCPLCRNSMVSTEKEELSDSDSGSDDSSSDSGSDSESDDGSILVHLGGEPLAFPTNVLFWGNNVQIRSLGDEATNGLNLVVASTSFPSNNIVVGTQRDEIVIEIPSQLCHDCFSLPSSTTRSSEDQDVKTPVVSRLRSFQRLLSRGSSVAPWASASSTTGSSSSEL